MKKISLLLFAFFLVVGYAAAQRTVSGTITDSSGEALIGANVLVKGTTNGTITDFDGNYALDVPSGSDMLTISYAGYTTKDVALGDQSTIDIILAEGVALDEIVVTGLGIKKEKKALGYAVTTLGSADIELKPEADISRVLKGKVAGVDILATSGLAGSGTNVVIRGYSSISGSNQALFVVDGVPFSSGTDSDRGALAGNATTSSRFLDLDPNSIAEVSVLKGLSATVLYGEAGRNGVILVTTKNSQGAKKDKGFEVTVDQAFYTTQIASLPDDQDAYGNGFWNSASAAFSNWGAPFEPGVHSTILQNLYDAGTSNYDISTGTIPHPYDRAAYNTAFGENSFAGQRYDYKPYDNLQNFFQDGSISNTSVFASKSLNANTSVNLSFSSRKESGFIDLSDLARTNVGLGINTKLDNNITIGGTLNYVNLDKTAPPTSTSTSSNPNDGASLFSNIFYTPRSIDVNGLPYALPTDGSSIYYRGGNDIQHPLWTLNNSSDGERVNRLYGTLRASLEVSDALTVGYRVGFDNYSQKQTYSINRGGRQVPDGFLTTSNRNIQIQDHNFSATFVKDLSETLNFDIVGGVNLRQDKSVRETIFSSNQFVYGLLTHDNFIDHDSESFTQTENLIGAYASATFGFKNFLYLNVAARNDWTSTLEKENRSFFYPSASVSFVASDALPSLTEGGIVDYLKLRVGYGTSAGYPSPYSTRNNLSLSPREFITRDGTVVNTNAVSNVFGNPALTPELHAEYELGLEARFLKNRIGLDLSLYNKYSTDLIFPFPADATTGFTETTINVAEISNKGVEVALDVTAVQTQDFTAKFFINFTKNVNVTEKLTEGVSDFVTDELFSDLGPAFIVGETYGVIWGDRVLRDDATGLPIVSSSGFYQIDPNQGVIADPNPNFISNYGLNLNYKGFGAFATMTYQDGGQMYSVTPSTLMSRGVLQETDFDRFIPIIAPGLKTASDGTLVANDIQITATDHYWRNGGVFIQEQRIFDATYLKLREVGVSYSLPKSVFDNLPFGSATLTLTGQNLWYNAFGFPPGANFDPEVLSTGVGNFRGFEFMNVPSAKQFGGSIRVTF